MQVKKQIKVLQTEAKDVANKLIIKSTIFGG
jgi:hypothetical protein